MSYNKLGFSKGQILMAEHLNHIEEGIAQIANNPSGGAGGSAIIDVLELPTENINTGAFYRLTSAKFVSNYYGAIDGWTCHYVDGLPEVGEPVSADMVNITGYYNVQDNEVYGYADNMISAAGGIPVGWYPIGILGQAFEVDWGGVITDVSEVDDSAKVLLTKDYYIYQDGWCKLPFACEKAPAFDIQWDGEIGDRFALDLTPLGFEGVTFVKVSDDVFTIEQLDGATYAESDGYSCDLYADNFDTATYAGAMSYSGLIVCYSADDTNAALGLPAGYLTNGVYFAYNISSGTPIYTTRLVSPARITKIDSKYLDMGDVQVDLSNYTTISQVETMIANAIGSAIRGSY